MSIYLASRIVPVVVATLFLTACSHPSNSNETHSARLQDRIVGTWQFATLGNVEQTYSNNGGFRLFVIPLAPSSRPQSQDGTWSIESNRLTVDTGTQSVVLTILKLEDSVLVYEATNKHGEIKDTTWKRIK
jgi:hypothetical protein